MLNWQKRKMREPLRSKIPWRLFLWERRWNDAKETEASMLLSRMPEADRKRFCEEHEKLSNSHYEKYGRDKAAKKRYGRAWKRIRDKYAAEHPFCELCFERGIIVPTEEIHHKLPLSEGGTHDRSNLIALCKSCHSTIHAKRGDYWGNHRG